LAPPLAPRLSQLYRRPVLYVTCFLAFCVVAFRLLTVAANGPSLWPCVALLAAVLLLWLSGPILLPRSLWYRYCYFGLQTCLVEALGLLFLDQDMWGLLYMLIGLQACYYLPLRATLVWGTVSVALMMLTMLLTRGWVNGLGLGLTYVAVAVLLASWEIFSTQAEEARRESDQLLAELQIAHQKLQLYAAEAEERTALRERDRLAHLLHDSVGQTIFGLTFSVESARLLLDKDPGRVPQELERLQELTSGALSQMRSLITQWRPK
jgi:signal transduction histidine kinase